MIDAESRSFPIHVRATVPSTAVRTTAASCSLEQLLQSALSTRPVRVLLNSAWICSSKSVNNLYKWWSCDYKPSQLEWITTTFKIGTSSLACWNTYVLSQWGDFVLGMAFRRGILSGKIFSWGIFVGCAVCELQTLNIQWLVAACPHSSVSVSLTYTRRDIPETELKCRQWLIEN